AVRRGILYAMANLRQREVALDWQGRYEGCCAAEPVRTKLTLAFPAGEHDAALPTLLDGFASGMLQKIK
ncbi:MAG: hypothetical protein WA817_22100, partial [Candidatus Acidiferrum sp.]